MMTKTHDVTNVVVNDGKLRLTVDGKDYAVSLEAVSPRLATASPDDQARVEISPSGYGLHWPTVDEDLSVTGLMRYCSTGEPVSDVAPG